MELIKKRSTAFIVLIIVIIFGTLFGVHRSVGKETEKIEGQFYSGVKLDNYTQASIGDMLDERIRNSMGAISLAANYDELQIETESLRKAREKLISAHTIPEKYLANESLTDAAHAMRKALEQLPVSERDSEGFMMYLDDIESAKMVIDSSRYNTLVQEFYNHTLREFPLNILHRLAFCKYPDYFNVEG